MFSLEKFKPKKKPIGSIAKCSVVFHYTGKGLTGMVSYVGRKWPRNIDGERIFKRNSKYDIQIKQLTFHSIYLAIIEKSTGKNGWFP